jgi:hypothetical protein
LEEEEEMFCSKVANRRESRDYLVVVSQIKTFVGKAAADDSSSSCSTCTTKVEGEGIASGGCAPRFGFYTMK